MSDNMLNVENIDVHHRESIFGDIYTFAVNSYIFIHYIQYLFQKFLKIIWSAESFLPSSLFVILSEKICSPKKILYFGSVNHKIYLCAVLNPDCNFISYNQRIKHIFWLMMII